MRVFRLVSSVAPMALVAACGAAPASSSTPKPSAGPPAEITAENVAEGGRLFNNGVCVNCHGSKGSGSNGGPALSDKTWLHGNGSYGQIVAIIKDGFSLGDIMDESYRRPMPPRGRDRVGKEFNDKEVGQIAAYVWSLSHPEIVPKAP